jgi:isopentenyl diphosphate isomerase/L-lactate dehydrogenase-like FMN-dependent dehydrogenase
VAKRRELEAAIDEAIRTSAFTLVYQPIVVLGRDEMVGVEAQLYTPTDRERAESLVQRAETAGFRGIVVTLDTWITGWRPRDLAASNFPQLRGHCLAEPGRLITWLGSAGG